MLLDEVRYFRLGLREGKQKNCSHFSREAISFNDLTPVKNLRSETVKKMSLSLWVAGLALGMASVGSTQADINGRNRSSAPHLSRERQLGIWLAAGTGI